MPPMQTPEQLSLTPEEKRAFARAEELTGGRVLAAARHQRWRPGFDIDVQREGEVLPLCFRGDRGEMDHGIYPLEHELAVLQLLEAEGLPAPHIFGFCEKPRGIVMERCAGVAGLANAQKPEEARAVLEHYMELLAALHSIPPRRLAKLNLPAPQNAQQLALGDFLQFEKAFRARQTQPEPLLDFAINWLKRNNPYAGEQLPRPPALIASDSGQFLFAQGRVTALLDFELAHLGDPLADLAGMLCRDLSEPMPGLSRAFAHYGRMTGAPVNMDIVHYHTIRFGLITPLVTAPLCAAPPPGMNIAQYLGWNLVYARIPLELMARKIGAELSAPEQFAAQPHRFTLYHGNLVQELEAAKQKAGGDNYELDSMLRTALLLREAAQYEAAQEMQELEEAGELLGRRPNNWRECDSALAEFVREAGPQHDAALVRFFHRRIVRQEKLLRPAMRELANAQLQEITL